MSNSQRERAWTSNVTTTYSAQTTGCIAPMAIKQWPREVDPKREADNDER